eukprot:m51a1_g3336 hypothetical protein (669) ;mRNA; r:387224-390103
MSALCVFTLARGKDGAADMYVVGIPGGPSASAPKLLPAAALLEYSSLLRAKASVSRGTLRLTPQDAASLPGVFSRDNCELFARFVQADWEDRQARERHARLRAERSSVAARLDDALRRHRERIDRRLGAVRSELVALQLACRSGAASASAAARRHEAAVAAALGVAGELGLALQRAHVLPPRAGATDIAAGLAMVAEVRRRCEEHLAAAHARKRESIERTAAGSMAELEARVAACSRARSAVLSGARASEMLRLAEALGCPQLAQAAQGDNPPPLVDAAAERDQRLSQQRERQQQPSQPQPQPQQQKQQSAAAAASHKQIKQLLEEKRSLERRLEEEESKRGSSSTDDYMRTSSLAYRESPQARDFVLMGGEVPPIRMPPRLACPEAFSSSAGRSRSLSRPPSACSSVSGKSRVSSTSNKSRQSRKSAKSEGACLEEVPVPVKAWTVQPDDRKFSFQGMSERGIEARMHELVDEARRRAQQRAVQRKHELEDMQKREKQEEERKRAQRWVERDQRLQQFLKRVATEEGPLEQQPQSYQERPRGRDTATSAPAHNAQILPSGQRSRAQGTGAGGPASRDIESDILETLENNLQNPSVTLRDVDGDGLDEILVSVGASIRAIRGTGQDLWSTQVGPSNYVPTCGYQSTVGEFWWWPNRTRLAKLPQVLLG